MGSITRLSAGPRSFTRAATVVIAGFVTRSSRVEKTRARVNIRIFACPQSSPSGRGSVPPVTLFRRRRWHRLLPGRTGGRRGGQRDEKPSPRGREGQLRPWNRSFWNYTVHVSVAIAFMNPPSRIVREPNRLSQNQSKWLDLFYACHVVTLVASKSRVSRNPLMTALFNHARWR